MPLTNVSELRAFLATLGTKPKRGLSQNFFIDGNIVRKIVESAQVSKGDVVLEIGPGPGALTEAIYEKEAKIIAVEPDRVFANALHRFAGIDVHPISILDFDFHSIPANTKVISNLPFHLTGPILTRLVPRNDLFKSITVVVQEEVAKRIGALPKTKEYGSLTVFLHFYADVCYAFKVSRHSFYPQPNVDAAVVTLIPHPPPDIDEEAFFRMVRKAFQKRRKMLKKTLEIPEIEKILEEIGENPKARPEEISLEGFLKLFLSIHRSGER